MDAEAGWTQQLHFGALRNVNTPGLAGCSGRTPGTTPSAISSSPAPLARFLDRLDGEGRLARTILYMMNRRDNDVAVTVGGCFQDGTHPGQDPARVGLVVQRPEGRHRAPDRRALHHGAAQPLRGHADRLAQLPLVPAARVLPAGPVQPARARRGDTGSCRTTWSCWAAWSGTSASETQRPTSGSGGSDRCRRQHRTTASPKTPRTGCVLVTATTFGLQDPALKSELERAVGEVRYTPEKRPLTATELAGRVQGVDAWIAGLDEIDASVIAAADRLKLIARYGVGVDRVDLEAATRRGIAVTHTPGANSAAVAELTIGLMLALARQICMANRAVREGRWPRIAGVGLGGKTVGLVGFGAIGRETARRLAAFGCRVLVADPYVSPEAVIACGAGPAALDELLPSSDFVCLHAAATPETTGMVNASFLGRMKPGAFLVNTARGELIDEARAGAGDRKRAAARGRARLLPRRAAADRPPAAAAAAGDRHPPHRGAHRRRRQRHGAHGARCLPGRPARARGRRTWSTPRFTQARTGHETHPVFCRHRPGHRQLQGGRRGRHRPRPRLRGWASTRAPRRTIAGRSRTRGSF